MSLGKRLRIKFIVVAMASVVVVLAGIVTAINVANYVNVCEQADAKLELLAQNDGQFPESLTKAADPDGDVLQKGQTKEDPGKGQVDPGSEPGKDAGLGKGMSAETPFETRYFTVSLDSRGSVASVNVSNIMAVSSSEAQELAQGLFEDSSEKGFYGVYRYLAVSSDNQTMYLFLDCTNDLDNFQTFLLASAGISFAGLLLVLVLVLVLSRFAVRPVEESYAKQKAFITDASHEIKTPLAVISAANEIQEMEQGETEWTRSIAEQVQRLSGLTERLVQLARMDEGTYEMKRTEVDLSALVRETAEPFASLAVSRGKELALAVEPGVTCTGDAAALTQVVELLLDNATRYAKDGCTITVDLRKQGKRAKLSVSNAVEHMPQGNLDKLFERFYRDDSSRSSQTGGTGVGLSVVRSIAEAHGGTASVSAEGNVITFAVLL